MTDRCHFTSPARRTLPLTMTPPRVDAHLHLPPPGRASDDFLVNTHNAGIGILALNSTCEQDWPRIISSGQRCPAVAPFLGIHPWWASEATEGWQERLLKELLRTGAAIGEIGLDALNAASPDTQEAIFIPQLEMAEHLARPVTIHCCRRWGRLIELLTAICKGRSALIIHGFSGSLEVMRRLLDLGAMLSFGPTLTNPARVKARQAFQAAPLERILLESDWPLQVSTGDNQSASQAMPGPDAILADLYPPAAGLRAISPQQLQTMVWNNGQIFTH